MPSSVSRDREILVIRANETVRQSWLEALQPLSQDGYKSKGVATRKETLEEIDLYKIGLIVANEDFTSKGGISELPKALKEKGHGDTPVILIVAAQTHERFGKKAFEDLYKDLKEFPKVMLIQEPFRREELVKAASELLMGADFQTRQLRNWAEKRGLNIEFKKNGIATITLKKRPPATADTPAIAPADPHP